jgi:Uri superfamily endonuclease
MEAISNQSGTYLLVLKAEETVSVAIGKKQTLFHCIPGYYYYVGSAFGPGGIAKRIQHHLQVSERPHWHIDYLRRYLPVKEIWYSADPVHREHQWAQLFSKMYAISVPLHGFGSSDCDCVSHLFYSKHKRSISSFRKLVRKQVSNHQPFKLYLAGD